MAMRITGMISQMDTESMVAELVKVQKGKAETIKKSQTILQWKQEAWQALNTKALNLFNKVVGPMRFSDVYSKKVTNVSDESAVRVTTGSTAVNGVRDLVVKEVAKTGDLTGAKLDGTVKSDTTLSQLTGLDASESINFSVTVGGKTTDINLSGSSKISDVVSKLKNAGLNASFDENNQRFFISSKTSGAAADFAITANSDNGFNALSKLGINVLDEATKKQYQELVKLGNDPVAKAEWIEDAFEADTKVWEGKKAEAEKTVAAKETAHNAARAELEAAIGMTNPTVDELDNAFLAAKNTKTELDAKVADGTITDDERELLADANHQLSAFDSYSDSGSAFSKARIELADVVKQLEDPAALTARRKVFEDDINAKFAAALKAVGDPTASVDADPPFAFSDAKKIPGRDAVITLNGAEYTSKNNSFDINGLALTVMKADPAETIQITTMDDSAGVYDMVKNFIKEYNAIINEMDKLYNAESARDYAPLTAEEKEAMSESEIKEWEDRIKNASLRRDGSLSDISGAMKNSMLLGVEVNGKKMYLSDFGINTLGFWDSADNEKSAFHIDGDADDSNTFEKANTLQKWIDTDPAAVTEFFTGLSKNLHGAMNEIIMESDPNFKSTQTLYNDKKMKSDLDDFKTRIEEEEARVLALEDRYYRQFAAMETALARMQSSQSAIAGLLGG